MELEEADLVPRFVKKLVNRRHVCDILKYSLSLAARREGGKRLNGKRGEQSSRTPPNMYEYQYISLEHPKRKFTVSTVLYGNHWK